MEFPKKVIFLDIDGVVATEGTYLQASKDLGGRVDFQDPAQLSLLLDRGCVQRINSIAAATGAVIVLSSTWRYSPGCREALEIAGLTVEIVGETPKHMSSRRRGREISEWIYDNGAPLSYVVLDDDVDILPHESFWVQSTFLEGLTDEGVTKAIEILGLS